MTKKHPKPLVLTGALHAIQWIWGPPNYPPKSSFWLRQLKRGERHIVQLCARSGLSRRETSPSRWWRHTCRAGSSTPPRYLTRRTSSRWSSSSSSRCRTRRTRGRWWTLTPSLAGTPGQSWGGGCGSIITFTIFAYKGSRCSGAE